MEHLIILAGGSRVASPGAPSTSPTDDRLAAPETLARAFASVAGDLALVLDRQGRILAAARGEDGTGAGGASPWVGRPWVEVVTPGSEGKAKRLLDEVLRKGETRGREINLAADDGHAMGFRCNALRLAPEGPVLVVGRDLGAQAALQHKLLALQQEMEGRYWAATGDAALTLRRRR